MFLKRTGALALILAFVWGTLPVSEAALPLSLPNNLPVRESAIALSAASSIPQELLQLDPKELARYMKKNFQFRDDVSLFGVADYWQNPAEFLTRGAGDCEDYALFSNLVFQMQGRESYVVSLYDAAGYGHTVTLFREDGKWNLMNEDRVYYYRAEFIQEVLTRIHPLWTWAAIARQYRNQGQAMAVLKNPSLSPT